MVEQVGLIDEVHARAELIFGVKRRRENVEARAVIEGEGGKHFPFVLQIQACKQTVERMVVRDVCQGRWIPAGVQVEDRGGGVVLIPRGQKRPAGSDRMGVAQLITAVGLQAGGVECSMHLAGLSVEIEVADWVRGEMLFALAAKGGDLKVQIAGGFLISEDTVIILLVLIFVVAG